MPELPSLKVADLFCGAGLYSAGFKDADFDIVFGIDINKNSCKTFKYNFPNADVICNDINKFDDFPHVDVIIGSPPCRTFSVGNNNRSFDMSLVDRFLEIIDKAKPSYWVMENVPAMSQTLMFSYNYVHKFPNIQIMKASDYGAATVRTRFFGGNFPKVENPRINRCVGDVIDINRPGCRPNFDKKWFRKIDPNKPLFTLCSQRIANERYLLPNGTSLTVSEMAICQSIPSWFVFPVSSSEMQSQIGKSVCPIVAQHIAERIKVKKRGDC